MGALALGEPSPSPRLPPGPSFCLPLEPACGCPGSFGCSPGGTRATDRVRAVAESTHSLTFAGDRVVKRYRSWDRGEPDREWGGLSLLHRYAPGTAPQPLSRRSEGAFR